MTKKAPITVTWLRSDLVDNGSFTKGDVTMTYEVMMPESGILNSPTFTTSLGKFTKIEVEVNDMLGGYCCSGTGWSGNTWTGNTNSLSCSGDIYQLTKIVFTIQPN